MLEAAAAFLSHQPSMTGSFAFLRLRSLLFFPPHIPDLSSLFLTLVIVVYFLLFSSKLHTLCLCLVPIFPLQPSSPLPPNCTHPALSACKMIAAVEPLPTSGPLMKAALRWKQRGTNCTLLCAEWQLRTRLNARQRREKFFTLRFIESNWNVVSS